MKKGDHIFVYGTLRRGERADLSKQSHQFGVTFCGEDAINGLLYHLGAFPGVKLPGEPNIWDPLLPVVVGEVFRIRDTSIVSIMDAYEGYNSDDPSTGLYDREEVETKGGRKVWVYVYNPPVISDQLIESGDWCKNQMMPLPRRALRR